MKVKTTLVLFSMLYLTCIVKSVKGQYIFNPCSAGLNWIGDSLIGTAHQYDSIAGMSSGSSGANALWDYTKLVKDSTYPVNHHYLLPSTTPYATSFTKANWCDYSKQDTTYSYEIVSADSAYFIGNKSARECSYPVWINQLIQICPTSFGTSWPEKYYANICINSGTAHDYRTGSYTYDAYGKLELPKDTFPNTARIKESVAMYDTITGIPVYGTEIVVQYDTICIWYNAALNPPVPVFSYLYGSATVSIPSLPYTGHKLSKVPIWFNYTHVPGGSLTSTEQFKKEINGIRIYPVPAKNEAVIEFSKDGAHSVEFDDVTGRKINSFECYGTNYRLECSTFPAGLYFVKVRSCNDIEVLKFIKE